MNSKKELVFATVNCKYYKEYGGNIFYRDDNELKNQENEVIKEEEFNKLIKDEINGFIYPFDNIVVLAGAGSSIVSDENGNPMENYGHTVEMLSKKVYEALENNDEFYSVKELSKICSYSTKIYIEDSENNTKKYNREFNLEDFLSKVLMFEEFIDEIENIENKKYISSKNEILRVIKEKTSYNFDSAVHKHEKLIKLLSDLHKSPNRLTVVTTNYDTLFEEAANKLNFTVFDGFSFDLNPVFDADIFNWSLVRPISDVKTEKMEFKKNVMNILKIHGSLTWEKKGDNIIRMDKNNCKNTVMIFPSSNKYTHSYEKPYFELFSKFQEYIKMMNTLLITIGFSFSDNHIAKMITQAIKTTSSLTVLITDYSIDSQEKNDNWKELEKLMEDGYRISFLKGTIDDDIVKYFRGDRYEN